MCDCESCDCGGVSREMLESIQHEMLVMIEKMEYLDENGYFEMAATAEEMETRLEWDILQAKRKGDNANTR